MAFEHLSCQQLKEWFLVKQEFTIVDIRDPQSFLQGHIEGAQHIDNSNVERFINSSDKTKPLVVCCYHGNSSQGAAEYFSSQGFDKSYSLDGGFTAWTSLN